MTFPRAAPAPVPRPQPCVPRPALASVHDHNMGEKEPSLTTVAPSAWQRANPRKIQISDFFHFGTQIKKH